MGAPRAVLFTSCVLTAWSLRGWVHACTTQSHGISCYSHEINLLIRVHQHDFAIFFVSHGTILKAM